MSCPSATAPINISKKSSSGKCDLKCAYSFQYKESLSTLVKNRGEYVSLSYAEQSGMIKYNTQSYSVREVRLCHPSLHEFEGIKYDGEMIIVHNNLKMVVLKAELPHSIYACVSSNSGAFQRAYIG